MKLCIAEKPSVAAEIALIVGAKSRRDGFYEGNDYCVTWTFGHLCTLKEPHDYLADWKHWYLGDLPLIPSKFGVKVINDKGVQKQFNTIEQLVQKADMVINCGDAGQEGELIQRWVLFKAGCNKPMKRLWISSLTEEAIKEGFEHLREGSDFDRLYAAGSSRAIGDWLLGMNATRLFTLKYGQAGQVLSIGRVQTPTLGLIVARQKEIESFVPEIYWELKTVYKEVLFSSTKGKFTTVEEGEQFLNSITEAPFAITEFSKKAGTESAPRLFDLTSLQVECNRKFAFSADETLKIIQSLYEKKVTTYPRVDTTYLSDDIYPKIPAILKGLEGYSEFTQVVLSGKIPKSKKVFDNSKVTDHHAIIPTGVTNHSLSRDEQIVFDLVTRRFIANFYPDCTFSTTTVMGMVKDVEFKATGKQIVKEGWRVVLQSAALREKSDEDILPEFVKGESGPHEPNLAEKETSPPKPYTEATLLRAMETAGKQIDDEELREAMKDNGIGRPSTRANIIETLFRRKYIERQKKNIRATSTGVQLIEVIQNDLLKSAELTGIWEKKLRQIERGEFPVEQFMSELKQMVADLVFSVKNETRRFVVASSSDTQAATSESAKKAQPAVKFNCPACNEGEMLRGNKAWGCSRYAEGCKTIIPFEFLGKKISEKQFSSLIQKRKTDLIKGFTVNGSKADGILSFDENFALRLEQVEKVEKPRNPDLCPACGKGEILQGRTAWGCSNYANGCQLRFPLEIGGFVFDKPFFKNLFTKNRVENVIITKDGAEIKGSFILSDTFVIEFVEM